MYMYLFQKRSNNDEPTSCRFNVPLWLKTSRECLLLSRQESHHTLSYFESDYDTSGISSLWELLVIIIVVLVQPRLSIIFINLNDCVVYIYTNNYDCFDSSWLSQYGKWSS